MFAATLWVLVATPMLAQDVYRSSQAFRPDSYDGRYTAPRRPARGPQAVVNRQAGQLVRLPPVTAEVSHAMPPTARARNTASGVANHGNRPADGTWSEDGRYLIINLNGQQLRLLRTDSQTTPDPALPQTPSGGDVTGRLSHSGRPLANCEVALIPLRKNWTGYKLANSSEALVSRTDGNGVYRLRNVPSGPYKLKWRPAGEQSWIRRAEIRPDVNVRANEASQVKEIRVALRTIN